MTLGAAGIEKRYLGALTAGPVKNLPLGGRVSHSSARITVES